MAESDDTIKTTLIIMFFFLFYRKLAYVKPSEIVTVLLAAGMTLGRRLVGLHVLVQHKMCHQFTSRSVL